MDFDDTPEEASFRTEAVRWLEERATRRSTQDTRIASLFEDVSAGVSEADWVASCRAWQRARWDGGYAAITWPKALGGREGSLMEEFIFAEEESRFEVNTGAFDITLGMVAPTILAHGTE